MSAEITQAFPGDEIELIKGHGGIFEVVRDGELLFSKAEVVRFPKPGEVAELGKKAAGK